jgi:hypothetical protein
LIRVNDETDAERIRTLARAARFVLKLFEYVRARFIIREWE